MEEKKKMKPWKIVLIVGIIVVALVLMFVIWGVCTNNSAIHREEQILESKSSVTVQENTRDRTIMELAQVVEKSSAYEGEVITKIAEARKAYNDGQVENATGIIYNLIMENYPELKSVENYQDLMNKISIYEQQVARSKENFNIQVRSYRKYVRSWPNSMFLGIAGYEVVDYQYYQEQENKWNFDPSNIFGD